MYRGTTTTGMLRYAVTPVDLPDCDLIEEYLPGLGWVVLGAD